MAEIMLKLFLTRCCSSRSKALFYSSDFRISISERLRSPMSRVTPRSSTVWPLEPICGITWTSVQTVEPSLQ